MKRGRSLGVEVDPVKRLVGASFMLINLHRTATTVACGVKKHVHIDINS